MARLKYFCDGPVQNAGPTHAWISTQNNCCESYRLRVIKNLAVTFVSVGRCVKEDNNL